ncbi:hypothetical protein [Brevibacterium picturae]|uniref:SEC-C motif-containing protein n=1 Tax=Brevibacterium picturae TaxID=260553 RepID=A0ABP4MXU1_9MICO
MATILDVVDNFFYRDSEDFRQIPASRLLEFGEEVRHFNDNNDSSTSVRDGCQYLGGWPSADSLRIGGGVIRSSLLFTEQVLIKDQISDWFSNETHLNEHHLSSSPGWFVPGEGPKVAETRAFLARVLPALRDARPLIENGVIVLAPMESIYQQHEETIGKVHADLVEAVLENPLELAARFDPQDLAIDDAQRGMFVFAGGNRGEQTRQAFSKALKYFSREYVSAASLGSAYCAPFEYERLICSRAFGSITSGSDRVREGLIRSKLPVFSGLSWKTLSTIHDDDDFGEFRRQLFEIYSRAPLEADGEEFDQYLEEQENVLLIPTLRRARENAERGPISDLGVSVKSNFFQLAVGIGAGIATGSPVLPLLTGAALIADHFVFQPRRRSSVAWTALVSQDASIGIEMPWALERPEIVNDRSTSRAGHPWGIPAQPSDSVLVSRGTVHVDWTPSLPHIEKTSSDSGYHEGIYAPCECGSLLSYKFCCRDVDRQYSLPHRRR